MAYIYKDYQIILDQLVKERISEKHHLLWKEGGVPCIDADFWDKIKGKVKGIRIMTDKGRIFKCQTFVFERHRKEVDLGWGRQYWIHKDYWTIINLHEKEDTVKKLVKEFDGEIMEDSNN